MSLNLRRYLLFQVPGWVVGAVVLVFLGDWLELPFWLVAVLFLVWVVKDFVIYPFIRTALNADVKTGVRQMVGTRGVARERLDPRGYVQIGGELWHAEIVPGHEPILPGSPVWVQNARGLTLVVATEKESDSAR